MNLKSGILGLLVFASLSIAHAQKVDVNVGSDSSDAEETTIQIKKNKGGSSTVASDSKPHYEITEGEDDIVADGAILTKPAKENWKKACADWKAELKENNKGNQVLTANCGTPTCAADGNETVCRSKAKHKIKVKLD